MKRSIMSFALALTMAAGAGVAETPVAYTENGRTIFTVEAPDFWSVRTGGPREITLPETGEARRVARLLALQPTTDDGVWMGFISPPGVATLAEAREYLREIGNFLTFEPDVTPLTPRAVAGLPAETLSGTGRRDGKNIRFTVALIDLPGDRVAVAAAVVEAGTDPVFVDAINDVYASIRAR